MIRQIESNNKIMMIIEDKGMEEIDIILKIIEIEK